MGNVMFNEGTESLSIEPANGGELMPVNQVDIGQPSNLEMAASLGITLVIGYGIGKLGEFLWKKAIVPGYIKAVDKVEDWKKVKDERIVRKKAEKEKEKENDILEGEFEEIINEKEEPDENRDEQTLPKKGMKSIDAMRKKRKH